MLLTSHPDAYTYTKSFTHRILNGCFEVIWILLSDTNTHTHIYRAPSHSLSLARSPKYIYTTHCILCIERLSRTCLTAATSLIESHIHMTTVQCVVPTLASPKHSYVGHKTKQIFISTRTIHFMKQFIFHMRWILLLSLSITLDRVGCFVLMYALLSLFRFVVVVSFI